MTFTSLNLKTDEKTKTRPFPIHAEQARGEAVVKVGRQATGGPAQSYLDLESERRREKSTEHGA